MSESNFAPGAQSSQELTVEIELTISAKYFNIIKQKFPYYIK